MAKKKKWITKILDKPACPPFCEGLPEDEEDGLIEKDVLDHYSKARSYIDLLQLNIDFLRGERASPNYFGNIFSHNPESITSLKNLITINTLGLLTINSQPGEITPKSKQRSYLDGVCNENLALHIYENLSHELIVTICPVEVNLFSSDNNNYMCAGIIVTYDAGEPYTFSGRLGDILHRYYDVLRPELADRLERLWKITIIDPVWGRNATDPGHLLDQTIKVMKRFKSNPYKL